MGSPLIGIEIGSKNIKIIYGSNSKKTFKVKKCGIIEIPDGVINDGNILNSDLLVEKISGFITENKIRAKKVALNIQSTSIITREIVIPKVNKKELDGFIELQKQEHFPIDITGYQVDYKINRIIKDDEGKESYEIMLFAVSKPFANKYMKLFEKMHLDVVSMDMTANSLAKFFETEVFYGSHEEKKSIVVIDMGDKHTNVLITSGGNILFSRAVLYGLSELNQVLKDEFPERNEEDIETFKKKNTALYSGDDIRQNDVYGSKISNVIKPLIENNLIAEINRFISFYNSKYRKKPITEIYIVGGGAYIKNINDYMKSIFKVDVILEKNVSLINQNKRKKVLTDDNIFYFINLIGLVRSYTKGKMNLLPKGYLKIINDKRIRETIMFSTVVAILVIFLIGMVPDVWIVQKNDLITRINSRMEEPKFEEVVVINNKLNESKLELDRQKIILNSIGNQSIVGLDILQTIIGAVPSEVYVKTITVDDSSKHITIAGTVNALHKAKGLEYVVNLQSIQGFRNIDFQIPFENNADEKTESEIAYTINFDIVSEGSKQ